MKHEDIRHMLSEYIDGAVTPGEKAAIEEHLASCPECSVAREELQKAVQHLRNLEDVEAPPWLSQKIMATVREEAEQKSGLLRTLFFPLRIKLPLQAVAVLFLAVTALYVSQSIQPTMRIAEGPAEEMTGRLERPATEQPRSREHKALDMKYAYEPVPPPVPQEGALPSSPFERAESEAAPQAKAQDLADAKALSPRAEEALLAGNKDRTAGFAARKKRQLTETAKAPVAAAKQKQAMPAEEFAVEEKAEERTFSRTLKEDALPEQDKNVFSITLSVKDITEAEGETRKVILALNGRMIEQKSFDQHTILSAEIDVRNLDGLIKALKRIGEVKQKKTGFAQAGNRINVTIRIE